MWTKERVEKLTPGEIKSLRKNALERGVADVVAICDEVFGGKLKRAVERARTERPPRPPRKVSRKKAMEMRGVKLHNPRWSWGGVRAEDGMPVLNLWADEIRKAESGFECLLWGPNVDGSRPWADSKGGKERLGHCHLAIAKGEGEGVLIYGEGRGRDLPTDQASKVDGADPYTVIRFRLQERGGEYWAVWDESLVTQEPAMPNTMLVVP